MYEEKNGRSVWRLGLILLSLAVLYLATSMQYGEPIRSLPIDWELRDGDILLLGSSTIRGRVLKFLDGGSNWGHCGIVVAPDSVVHADPKRGVIRQSIDEYLEENDVDCICVLRSQKGDGRIAASFALGCATQGISFDNSFDYKNGSGIYCTELILLSWEAAGVQLLPDATSGDSIVPSRLLTGVGLDCRWILP